jgi:ubiquinone/menaquinone biosynthesis C-methylase UbiE
MTTNSSPNKPIKPYKGMAMEGMIARWYNKNTRGRGDFQQAADEIARMLPKGSRVLEVAPGPGFLAIDIARTGLFQVTGLDISKTFVEIAQANAREAGVQIDFRHGDVAHMPFEDESFDFITCHAAFKNFAQPVLALQEMYRVLRPNGRVSIVDLRPDATPEAIDAEVKKMGQNALNTWFTRLTFNTVLLKNAHSKEEFNSYVAQTKFSGCEILESPLGLEVKLTK